jgi:CheY-like chemotaxis protein
VERDKAWTDMARRVAHDLKNPLTPIKLQLQMLMRMKASGNPLWQERFDEVAQTVLYHVDLLADSADQFSTFAKMYDQKSERLDLDALVQQEVSLFDSRDDVSLEYFGLPGSFVKAPRPQLTRVVVNLLTNAIQAIEGMEGEKRMLVSVRNSVEDGFYEIVVEDNGPGVSEQNQDKIFTPDFTTKTSGSGLGLAICKRLLEIVKGSISIDTELGKGFAIHAIAPVPVATAEKAARKNDNAASEVPAESVKLPGRVLVADDSSMNRAVLKAMLKKLGITDVVMTEDGRAALDVLEGDQAFDLVMTDMWMPVMDGDELVRRIRADQRLAHLKVCSITADVEARAKYKEQGFDAFLLKPVTVEKLSELFSGK